MNTTPVPDELCSDKIQRYHESRHVSQRMIHLYEREKTLGNILGDSAQLRVDLRRAGMCSLNIEEAVTEAREERLRVTDELRDLQKGEQVMGIMKVITYEEWSKRFLVIPDQEIESEIRDGPEDYAFYDNGAVRHLASGDYIVKIDQVERQHS